MAYRGINTYDAKKVIRPTMVPDREEARASGGAYTHMLETDFNGPPPPPPADPLAWDTQPTVTGRTQPGNSLTGTLGTVTGGTDPQPKGRWRWRASADAGNSWEIRTNWSTDAVQTYELQPEDVGQVQMQCQVTDPEVDTLSKSVVKTITAPALNESGGSSSRWIGQTSLRWRRWCCCRITCRSRCGSQRRNAQPIHPLWQWRCCTSTLVVWRALV